jgi:drug/metabolite transporter (DMT)-like permease
MNAHRLAVGAMLGAVAAFALMDGAMKQLADTLPPMQVAFLRGAASLPIFMAWLGWRHGLRDAVPVRWGLHLLRGFLGLVMLGSFVRALSLLSMGDAYVVYLSAPLLIALLSVPLLREHLSYKQWLAVMVGLAGVVLALRPTGAGLLGTGGAYAALAATSYALIAVTTRVLGRTDSAAAMTLWFLLVVTVGAGLLAWPQRTALAAEDAPWVLLLGLSGAVGQLLLTAAFRMAPPAEVAPLEYSALLWAFALDWLWWNATPDVPLLIGACLIVVSGLLLAREARRAHRHTSYETERSR